jgi:hypothetical protein
MLFNLNFLSFDTFTAVVFQVEVFWVVTPCSVVVGYQGFFSSPPRPHRLWGPPIQWMPGAPSLSVKRPAREADHSPPSSVEVKECVELYLRSPNTPSWHGAQFYFTFFNFALYGHKT